MPKMPRSIMYFVFGIVIGLAAYLWLTRPQPLLGPPVRVYDDLERSLDILLNKPLDTAVHSDGPKIVIRRKS